MSTLFFGHALSPLDGDTEAKGHDRHAAAGVTPVTWLPTRAPEESQDEAESTRGY